MNNGLVTVIIPIYNVERYLKKCVDSVINQTYTNLEILLVDDGSTDNCPSICDKYKNLDYRIKVFHKKNGGLSDARNYGLDNMSGDFVYFLDSDDYISIDAIEFLMNSQKTNNSDIVIGNSMIYDENNNQCNWSCDIKDDTFEAKELLDRVIIPAKHVIACNKLYRISVFNNVRFPLSLIHEDEYILSDVVKNSKIISTLSKVTYYYFQRTNGIMKSNLINHGDFLFALSHRLDYYLDKNGDKSLIDGIVIKSYYCFNEVIRISIQSDKKNSNISKYFSCYLEIMFKCRVNSIIKILTKIQIKTTKFKLISKLVERFIYCFVIKKHTH